ncbi:MAG: anti-sigma factor antagonist [Clostridia bacterium]|nr:anti-sigma factor antagonist [Clostridia bacterium]
MQIKSKNCRVDICKEKKMLRVRLSGEIDHHSAVAVRSEIDTVIAELRPERLVLDLSGIDFMDSSGIGLIMGRYAKMKAVGGEIVVESPNARVRRIFEMAGLERIVRIEQKKEGEK